MIKIINELNEEDLKKYPIWKFVSDEKKYDKTYVENSTEEKIKRNGNFIISRSFF